MQTKKKIIIARTKLDEATEVSYSWVESIKQHFASQGWEVIDFPLDDIIRQKVEPILLSDLDEGVFLFYGHGAEDKMLGQDDFPIIDLENIGLLKGKTVYTVSCYTAKVLGKKSENIARSYLGYRNEVSVWLREPYSRYLEKCVNSGILAMLNSNCTIEEAYYHIIQEYNTCIDRIRLGNSPCSPITTMFLADLQDNIFSLSPVIGDLSTRLV